MPIKIRNNPLDFVVVDQKRNQESYKFFLKWETLPLKTKKTKVMLSSNINNPHFKEFAATKDSSLLEERFIVN